MKAIIIVCFFWNAGMIVNHQTINSRITIEVPKKQAIEAEIKIIRQQYLKINGALKFYRIVKEDFPDQSTEGGEVTGYYNGKDLKKIVAVYYGETGKMEEEYYFADKQLIFQFRRTFAYDKPMYIKNSKVKSVTEDRFYFKKNELIRWLKPNGQMESTSSRDFKETNLDIKVIVEELINKLSQSK